MMRMDDRPRVLLLGARGMLGNTVLTYLQRKFEVIPYTSEGFNVITQPISDLHDVLRIVDVVVNCIGIIKPRIDSHSVEEVLKVNSMFPRALNMYIDDASDSDDWDCVPAVIHISSDCVFSGQDGPYTDRSIPDATDLYGISKALGEYRSNTILRTSIIGEEINNKYSLLEWAKSKAGTTVQGYTDHRWSGVTTLELAKIIEHMIDESYSDFNGITQVAGSTVTKYELLNMINDVYNLHLDIKPVESGNPIDRSLILSDNWIRNEYTPKPLIEQLEELKDFFNER